MSAAAHRCGIANSADSQIGGRLERQAGVTPPDRLTRKFTRRKRESAVTLVHATGGGGTGALRVTSACAGFASRLFVNGLTSRVGRAHRPGLRAGAGRMAAAAAAAAAAFADGHRLGAIDVVKQRINIGVRVGWTADIAQIASKLCDLHVILCAAPLIRRATASRRHPPLCHHQWLGLDRKTTEAGAPQSFGITLNDGGASTSRSTLPPVSRRSTRSRSSRCPNRRWDRLLALCGCAHVVKARCARTRAGALVHDAPGGDDGDVGARRFARKGSRHDCDPGTTFRGAVHHRHTPGRRTTGRHVTAGARFARMMPRCVQRSLPPPLTLPGDLAWGAP